MDLKKLNLPKRFRRKTKRLGLGIGSGTGKTAGKGHKGQRARSGAKRGRRTGFSGGQLPLFRHIPKIGFSNKQFKNEYQVVNLAAIEAIEWSGDVGPAEMREKRLVRRGSMPIKVLGEGDLSKAMVIRAHKFSRSAADKIAASGGSAEVVKRD